MPSYVSDGNGQWFDVSPDTLLNVQIGKVTLATAISGLNSDEEVKCPNISEQPEIGI